MHSTTYCGTTNKDSCAYYYNKNAGSSSVPSYTKVTSWTLNIYYGYNKLKINTYPCKKGYYLSMYYGGSGKVALNTNNPNNQFFTYTDMYWWYGSKGAYLFNLTQTWRYYVNALIDTTYYLNSMTLTNTYPTMQASIQGNLSATFVSTGLTISRSFSVTNSKYYCYFIIIFKQNS